MENLPHDLIEKIANYLNLDEILSFSISSSKYYFALDNIFYINLANKLYTIEFWKKASLRPIIKSKPLKSMKLELIRIENFQKMLDSLNHNRWTKKDFYNYWNLN